MAGVCRVSCLILGAVALAAALHVQNDVVTSLDDGHAERLGSPDEPPENGGSMVPTVQHTELTPNAFPEDDAQPSEAGLASGSGLVWDPTTPYTSRREGYEEVVGYLQQLSSTPATGSGTSMGSAMMEDPELAEVATRMRAQQKFIEQARQQMHHSEKMGELLNEDKEAVVNTAPFTPTKLQKLEAETQLKKLNEAIQHETEARQQWNTKRTAATRMWQHLQRKQLNLQKDYVKRDAEARAAYLQTIAKEHVDFNQWRASQTGPENMDYMKWKAQQKFDVQQQQENARMENIRHKVEASLEHKLSHEFTNVNQQVDAAMNHTEAVGIRDTIQSLALDTGYKEVERTNNAERNAKEDFHDLDAKLNDDMQWFQYHTNKAKVFAEGMKRHHLESEKDKLERLKGLYLAGVVRDKSQPPPREDSGSMTKQLFTAETMARYEDYLRQHQDQNTTAKSDRDLDEKVQKAKVKQEEWDKKRTKSIETLTNRLTNEEDNEQLLSGIRLRTYEKQAKLQASEKLKALNTRLASLDAKKDEKPSDSEAKAKQEIHEISQQVKRAKIKYILAKRNAVDAHYDAKKAVGHFDEDEETKVLPSQKINP